MLEVIISIILAPLAIACSFLTVVFVAGIFLGLIKSFKRKKDK